MTTTLTTSRRVDLLDGCAEAGCLELAWRMKNQLDVPKYAIGVSVMATPDSLGEWRGAHRTARKRADRAGRLGYQFQEIDRSVYTDDIFEINVSKERRQGRPMSAGYRTKHAYGKLPDYPCFQHRVSTYGVVKDEKLTAYLTTYRVGELVLVSMILGHDAHLQNDVMYLLFQGLIAEEAGGGGVIYYNRWDSGEDGLRYYKARVGMSEGNVAWSL